MATETWLSPVQCDGEIGEIGRFSSDYTIHRRDRDSHSKDGGVLIAVRNDLKSTRCEELEPDCELCWVKVEAAGEKSLYVGAYYRPNIKDSESLQLMKNSVTNLSNHTRSHIWLTGDFNLPEIDWKDRSIRTGAKFRDRHQEFLDTLDEASLSQMVRDPTRGGNVLDLFLTNNDTLVIRCEVGTGDTSMESFFPIHSTLPSPRKIRRSCGTISNIAKRIQLAWPRSGTRRQVSC